MSSFHSELKLRFNNRCIISNVTTIEANHIIPRYICSILGLDNIIFNSFNGLLITDSLHREFDHYYWTFDVNNITYSNDNKWISLSIITKPHYNSNLMIHLFQNNIVSVPIESLAFLWIHYQIFLIFNFTKFNNNSLLTDKYRELIYSSDFNIIYNNPLLFYSIRSPVFTPSYIISNRNFNQEMLVIDRSRPLSEMIWMSVNNLDKILVEDYLDHIENLNDPEWKPSSYTKAKISKNAYIYPRRFSIRLANRFDYSSQTN